MGISEQERVRRRDSVGASDVPAILGLCPFRTIHDVYLDKTANMNMAANDLRDNMAILVGEKMEMSVVHYGYEKFKDNKELDISKDPELDPEFQALPAEVKPLVKKMAIEQFGEPEVNNLIHSILTEEFDPVRFKNQKADIEGFEPVEVDGQVHRVTFTSIPCTDSIRWRLMRNSGVSTPFTSSTTTDPSRTSE